MLGSHQSVEARIGCLERRLRYHRLLIVVLSLAVLVYFSGSCASTTSLRVVEASEFVLREPSGRVAGRMFAEQGVASLEFFSGDGVSRLQLGTTGDGVGLFLRDVNGNERLELGVSQGVAALNLRNPSEVERATLSTDADGNTGFAMFTDAETRIGIFLTAEEEAQLVFLKDGRVEWQAP